MENSACDVRRRRDCGGNEIFMVVSEGGWIGFGRVCCIGH